MLRITRKLFSDEEKLKEARKNTIIGSILNLGSLGLTGFAINDLLTKKDKTGLSKEELKKLKTNIARSSLAAAMLGGRTALGIKDTIKQGKEWKRLKKKIKEKE